MSQSSAKSSVSTTTTSPLVHAAAGAASGTAVDLLVYPLNTIKTRLQLVTATGGSISDANAAAVSSSSGIAGGGRGTLYTSRVYAGVTTVLLSAPAFGVYMATYETFKHAVAPHLGAAGESMAGVAAQAAGSLVWVPLEVVRERQQVHAAGMLRGCGGGASTSSASDAARLYVGKDGGTLRALRSLLATRTGLASLYRGYALSLSSWAPFNALYFPLYEHCKRTAARIAGTDEPSIYAVNASALLAAAASAAATNPLDVLKTNVQVHDARHELHGGMLRSARSIYAAEGIAGFFRGAAARVVWLTPKHAMGFTVYELFKPYVRVALTGTGGAAGAVG